MDFWNITENFLWKDSEHVLGIKSLLLHNIKPCLSHLFPNGKFYKKKLCIADVQKDQIIVDMKAGNWSSLGTGKSGDIISLWALITGETKLSKVISSILEWLNTETFIYFDESGKDTIYIYYYNTHALSSATCYYAWSSKTCSTTTKPLFNIPEIIESERVVAVKGEKCAKKLTHHGITATTVLFGADESIDETDFSLLNGKHVIIWPDNNETGKQHAEKIANKLSNCSILNIPEGKKDGWNVLDAIAEGIDINQLLTSNNVVVKDNISAFSIKQYLSDKSPIPRDIIFPRILTPGGLLVFGGTPKVGKTDFLLSWLAHMSAGVSFFDMVPTKPLKIFYLQTDVGYHYMRERLQQLKIDNKLLSLVENNFSLKDALMATTAAPTYFAPKLLKINQISRVLVDGGVFANNPAACAYASAKRLFPNDNLILVSIGTGRSSSSIKYSNSKRFGKITWVKPLLSIIFSSGLDAINYQLEQVMNDTYLRIQSQLTIASAEMDNTTKKNIKHLQKEAQAMIEYNQKAIDNFCHIFSINN